MRAMQTWSSKERWAVCKADSACFKRINDQMQRWLPPNKERATRVTGMVDPVGKVDSDGQVDLRDIRKPGFFARAPYDEAIAQFVARLPGTPRAVADPGAGQKARR